MSSFKIFFKHYLQFFLYLILVLLVIYFFTGSSFALGLIIGTVASAISAFVWHHYLYRAINSESLYISSGMGIRFLIATMACLFWVRFPEAISIYGIALGLTLTYVMILIHTFISLKQ
ncbi:ATP synthase subunit I [Macrococcus bovicus]|uniref:ATP synthase subunit I n=1 Tax=Macrococcus bovicus TaxID=69968 RepID=UPI0025A5F7EA|nr:ATP synthase subunit I [Macrococcus bovicus]WJP97586.1 ATP synthase subunit I [Macrococcus bovicus]